MGKAIAGLSVIVLFSFAFVLLHLSLRRPAGTAPSRGPAPRLVTREDGSVYAVDLQLSVSQQRLTEAEQRSQQLAEDLEQEKRQREELEQRIAQLQAEVRRLRQRPPQPAPAPVEPEPSELPPDTPPVEPPVTPPPVPENP